jgi:murein DD-endopeptidase MepM/ murein hydrolase activator NlpD
MFLNMIFTPITIMMVPHSRTKPVSIRIPLAGILFSVFSFFAGVIYLFTVAVHTVEYYQMRERLSYVTTQFHELKSTLHSLKQAERDFKKLFSLKSKTDILETADFVETGSPDLKTADFVETGSPDLKTADFSDTGSLDMEVLRKQIDEAMRSVSGIKQYIVEQKDLYQATPLGWPAQGRISSSYGYREHPKSGQRQLHTGMDISLPPGTKVRATADGIVSFSGWTVNSGNVVVIEHGHGFSTAYAHNRENLIQVGERVKRYDAVAVSGSTGRSTGPHLHYEIWKDERHVNPSPFLARR